MQRNAPIRAIALQCVLWTLTAGTQAGCGAGEPREAVTDGPAGPAAVAILRPVWGDTVSGPRVEIELAARGITLGPAGTPGTGHLHVMVDQAIVPEGVVIPGGPGIIHLGDGGTTSATEDLIPGPHILIAVVGDAEHVRLTGAGTDTVLFVVR